MKSKIKFVAVVIFILLTKISFGQSNSDKAPRWVPNEGHWVVEQNNDQPRHNIIRFYNDQDELVYTEALDGIVLDVHRKKVKMKLKKLLEDILINWTKNKTKETNRGYVAAVFK